MSAQVCTASTLGSLAHLLQCSVQLELEKARSEKYTVIDTHCCPLSRLYPMLLNSFLSKLPNVRGLEQIQCVK